MGIDGFLNSTAVVNSLLTSQSSVGTMIKDYSTVRIAALKCRLANRSMQETDEFGKPTTRQQWKVYCLATSANRAISVSDRIVVGGRTFEIRGIYNPGLLDRHLEIEVEEVV